MKTKISILFLVIIFFSACWAKELGDYNFVTDAEYFAKKSDLHIILHGEGYVPPKDDATNGSLQGKIYSDKYFSDTIFLEINEGEVKSLKFGEADIKIVESTDIAQTFLALFKEINYTEMKHRELKEMFEVIEAVAHGPKALFVMGQTTKLKTVDLTFEKTKPEK